MSGLEAAALTALGKAGTALVSATQHEITYEAAIKLVIALESFGSKEMLHPDFVSALEEMDIKASVMTIEALIEDLRAIKYTDSKSVDVCLTNLNETVTQIENLLEKIEKKCQDHVESWWAYVYSYPDCSKELASLKTLKSKMDNRIDLLTRAVTLELQMKSMEPSNNNNNNNNNTKHGTTEDKEDMKETENGKSEDMNEP